MPEFDLADRAAVILSAARTPMGRFQGALAGLSAPELGAAAVQAAAERAALPDLAAIDEVLLGNVVSAGVGQAPARQAALRAGLPPTVSATTLNKVCGSGLKTVMLAAQAVRAGDGDLYIAGGMESMSRAPFLVPGRGGELRFGHLQLTDALLHDGLWDPFEGWSMGDAAEYIAQEFEVTREAMDAFALHSQELAAAAQAAGRFAAEITPVTVAGRKGATLTIEADETPRPGVTLAALHALPPAFQPEGKVTAGNAAGLNDGAAALVVASAARARQLGCVPLAVIRGYTQAAVAPKRLFAAPALAIPKLLDRLGWTLAEVDLIELNEAFAAQVLANGYALAERGWDWARVNVNGGAIALGHPLGASGARVLTTLLYAMQARGARRGIAALCLGGGEAVALAVEHPGA